MDDYMPLLKRRITPFLSSLPCLFLVPCLFFCESCCGTLEQGIALQELKNSGWITKSLPSWVAGTDPCVQVWAGVDCDTQGNIITLVLTSNEVATPTFPAAIFQLNKLTDLRVDNTLIGGEFPKRLIELRNLQYLYLGNNSFTGDLPGSELGLMTNLKELTIWGNLLTGVIPPELGNLKNLTYLNLNKNKLYGGLPPELGKLSKLQRLLLYKNKLTGRIPEEWREMSSIQVLELNANYLCGAFPSWLLQIPRLSMLQLSNNQIHGSIDESALNHSVSHGLKNLLLECNYLGGIKPRVQNSTTIKANLDYNCWDNEDSLDSACVRPLNCFNFRLRTANGACPDCPSGQYMINTTTCICYAVPEASSKKFRSGPTLGAVAGVVFLLVLLLLYLWWRSRRQAAAKQLDLRSRFQPDYFQIEKARSNKVASTRTWEVPTGIHHFTIEDLVKATGGFDRSNEIGEGCFGKVYVGRFPDGRTLAIKRGGPAKYSSEESDRGQFRNEVLLLSRLHHKNLVRLEGFCDDEDQQILVYEYMKLGNLHRHLHGIKGMTFDWYKRLEIAVDVARGLDYLHSFADPPVIHRDVKPSNILLDDNLVAKIADFGISKESSEIKTHVSTGPAGTAGYFDPQYFLRRQLTTASDVYSFGVVLLELISGRKAIAFHCPEDEESNLIEWTKQKMEQGRAGIESVVDPKLEGVYPRELFETLVDLGLKCSSFKRNVRPTMKVVVSILDPLLQAAKKPPRRNISLPSLQMWPSQPLLPPTKYISRAGDIISTTESDENTIRTGSLESITRTEVTQTLLYPR
ncbi:uncharacterized protein [Physcomitrium patens]|uniref:uncharacterized protein isoform X3 n=1 Tax=Physcomitrium patens TaxID=3218 RepID=UPI000D15BF83|nr:protein NSP-INTERACTING KINASE 2-like isoform X3 [Physcomitrium patens]|eukprot:XP_024381602.1 protein NSP-INTERACTING KINASE 2-like isoform X3 [Physcomitrella patens]